MLRFTALCGVLATGACALLGYAPPVQATLATTIPDGAIGQIALNAQSGYSVANAGDLNGDGFQDMAVGIYGYSNGETSEGAVFIYFGAATGVDPTADAVLELNQANARFGASVASAGDVNGDGFDDLIVGAPFFDVANPDDGRAFVYFGGPAAFDTTADAVLGLSQGSAFFGVSVAGAGDVNGDGYADVLVGSSGFDGAATNTGAALLYFGGAGAFNTTVDANLQSANGGVRFGSSVAGVGDVNGDGFADIVIGSPFYANGQANEGAAFLYLGGAGAFNVATDAHYETNQADAEFGTAVAAAGDLNGDGFSDVIIGALRYDNGQADEGGAFVYYGGSTPNSVLDATLEANQASAAMGNAVASLGDVNADGYADIAVGAPLFDGSNADSGQVLVYLGAAAGIVTAPYKQFDAGLTQPARLGFALSGGDFNGDGYTDLIAGTPDFTGTLTGQGRALVYFGGTVTDTGVADARVESGQGSGQLGQSVATGDVNGDGFADLVSGAFGYDGTGGTNSGRVSLYFGGAAGFNTAADAQLNGSLPDMRAGGAVAVGDINGDGYGDVIVGAPETTNGSSLEGSVLIYFGGAGAFNTTVDATIEINQIGAAFGFSVAYAGDVNGDGYADVLVGAPEFDVVGSNDEGAAFLYLGSATPFVTTHAVRMNQTQLATRQGFSVAFGDVNGDGFSDPIVGAPSFDGGAAADEGAASVYLSNGVGKAVLAQQFSALLTAPVDDWGLSQNPSGFTVGMTSFSSFGRERSKLELEACPNGIAYGAGSCVRFISATWTDTTAAANGVVIAAIASGLTTNRIYHWRARTLYTPFTVTQAGITAPSNPRRGPWRRMRAGSDVADVRVIEFAFRNGFE